MDEHDQETDPWWYPEPEDHPAGQAAPVAATGAGDDDFQFHDIEDLLGLAWEVGVHVPCVRSSPPRAPPEPPPSEEVMAAWLYPIISGEDNHNAGGSQMVNNEPSTMATESKGKLPATEGIMADVKETNINIRRDCCERRKAALGGSNRTRSSNQSQTHNVTEKRRRCKISERLRTLQQLVPGCEKTNQASTLEQTIQYMKSLQQQVQAMDVRSAHAVYPMMQMAPAPAVAVADPGTVVAAGGGVPLLPAGMAPFPYPQYHAVMMPAPFYPPQPAASAAPEGQCSVSAAEQHYNKGKGGMRL